jgi:hypothetical protein
VISALTVPFAVTLFVNTVLAVFTIHPLGVEIFSLAVNVNTKFPLVHAACVIVHVGFIVSIHLHVTVTSFVVSPSANVITHVSSHILLSLGVYVILFPFILHVHFVHLLFVSTVAVTVSQLHALASLKSFQLTVCDVFHTFVCPMKSCPVNTTSAHVYVTVSVVSFHALSFTFTVTV